MPFHRGKQSGPWTDEAKRIALSWDIPNPFEGNPVHHDTGERLRHNRREQIVTIFSVPDEQLSQRNKRKLSSMAAGGSDTRALPPDPGTDQWFVFAHNRFQWASEYERDHPGDDGE